MQPPPWKRRATAVAGARVEHRRNPDGVKPRHPTLHAVADPPTLQLDQDARIWLDGNTELFVLPDLDAPPKHDFLAPAARHGAAACGSLPRERSPTQLLDHPVRTGSETGPRCRAAGSGASESVRGRRSGPGLVGGSSEFRPPPRGGPHGSRTAPVLAHARESASDEGLTGYRRCTIFSVRV